MTPADIHVGSEVWVNGHYRKVIHVSQTSATGAVVTIDLYGPYRYVITTKDRIR